MRSRTRFKNGEYFSCFSCPVKDEGRELVLDSVVAFHIIKLARTGNFLSSLSHSLSGNLQNAIKTELLDIWQSTVTVLVGDGKKNSIEKFVLVNAKSSNSNAKCERADVFIGPGVNIIKK